MQAEDLGLLLLFLSFRCCARQTGRGSGGL